MRNVSARRLRDRTIRWRRWQGKGSLFPLFRSDGTVRYVLLVLEAGELRLLRLQPGAIRVPRFGPVTVADSVGIHRIRSPHDAASVAGLWHFDPGWLLSTARHKDHPAAPFLKATNCVSSFNNLDVKGLSFSHDLRSVTTLDHTVDGEGQTTSWSREWLGTSPAELRAPRPGWTMVLSWERRR